MTVAAVRATSLLRWRTLAAQDVLAMFDRLNVPGIHTTAHAAQVVKFGAFGNWSDTLLIREDVRLPDGTGLPISAVALGERAAPPPAVAPNRDLLQESLRELRYERGHLGSR